MIYLSRMLGKPVLDATGEEIGRISDVAIATGEVFPRVTSLAFRGPDKTPFMLSWRKFVEVFDGEKIELNVAAPAIRFSYLQPDEVLLARDLMNKQIVDTQGMKVVRANLSAEKSQLVARLRELEVVDAHDLHALRVDDLLAHKIAREQDLVGLEVAEADVGCCDV